MKKSASHSETPLDIATACAAAHRRLELSAHEWRDADYALLAQYALDATAALRALHAATLAAIAVLQQPQGGDDVKVLPKLPTVVLRPLNAALRRVGDLDGNGVVQFTAVLRDHKLRYWVSWYTSTPAVKTDYQCWLTGETADDDPAYTLCAVIDAATPAEAWARVTALFADAKERFIEGKPAGWVPPADRFLHFKNKT